MDKLPSNHSSSMCDVLQLLELLNAHSATPSMVLNFVMLTLLSSLIMAISLSATLPGYASIKPSFCKSFKLPIPLNTLKPAFYSFQATEECSKWIGDLPREKLERNRVWRHSV
ncbi:Hypothetical predicted protein [Olea europaea subsp. europaea]|uniref:Uncharacterized protein n=1 Tax=Olea europaea subsp. europaea TaxID=158383 RepID=A0A8S0PP73_OLEEU|nr:Hypothetical predicted protein [Olea europaea subsp. europaea]